jgi:N-methylhydantoinase A
VRTALSGPAAGVIAATAIAKAAGFDNIITCDMGGTSFDVSLIATMKRHLRPQTAIDFGMVVRTPMIEITTIGAGGGSIAWVDKGGLLQVGPESAGSDPGPVCYGLGNDRPTVTDANVVLGRINPDRPIGGKLDAARCRGRARAIDTHVGNDRWGSTTEAAEAILRSPTPRWPARSGWCRSSAARSPKRFGFMPFGGGGALHTGALIKEVGIGLGHRAALPGVTSALGCVVADMRHDRVQTVNRLTAIRSRCRRAAGRDAASRDDDRLALLETPASSFEARDRGLRARHALCRPDPHGRRGLRHRWRAAPDGAPWRIAPPSTRPTGRPTGGC